MLREILKEHSGLQLTPDLCLFLWALELCSVLEAALQRSGPILGLARTFQKVPDVEEGGVLSVGFWPRLCFGPGPVHSSLDNLVAPGSQEVTILMQNSVQTSDQLSAPGLLDPRDPPVSASRVAGSTGLWHRA